MGSRYHWHGGYWALPPYPGSYWVAPRYYKHRYYPGYWERGGRSGYRLERRGWGWDDGRWGYRDRGYNSRPGYHQHHKRRGR